MQFGFFNGAKPAGLVINRKFRSNFDSDPWSLGFGVDLKSFFVIFFFGKAEPEYAIW